MEKIVCIAKSRKMRDSLLLTFLSLVGEHAKVVALGRPLDDAIGSNDGDGLTILDADTRNAIAQQILPLKRRCEDLKRKLSEMPKDMFYK